jgi:predicted RecA/RadA family phage recombinase
MTMRVTITTTLMGEAGSLLTAGSIYTVSDAFGAFLVGGKRATDTDGVLRNLLQKSDVIRVTAPYTLVSGDGCYVGAIFGVSTGPITSGVAFDMMTTGIFVLAAASAAVATAGDKAYWDNAARNITTNPADVLIGVFSSNKTSGQLVATVSIGVYVAGSGGGGGGTWGSITGTLSAQTDVQAAIDAKATAYAPVALTANTTLTRAAHYNRQIIVTNAGAVTLTATGTDALLGDFISIDVLGGGSVTLAGVTAQTGYTLTAASGDTVEAKSNAAASLVAATQVLNSTVVAALANKQEAKAVVALVDGSFTANNLNLTSTHVNCILDLSAVTIPVTLTWQTDVAGSYPTTSCLLRVLAGPLAPVAIVVGAGATFVGGTVQVIEQSGWGGGQRSAVNTLALEPHRRSSLSGTAAMSQFGFVVPLAIGSAATSNVGINSFIGIDGSTNAAVSSVDGVIEYGALRRIRLNSATATANKTVGIQHNMTFRLDAVNTQMPFTVRGAISDALPTAPFIMGMCSLTPFGLLLNSNEPSASGIATDLLVIAADSTDTNMQLMHKSNATAVAATKVDLGASFPKSQFVGYELTVYKNNAGTTFMAVIKNMNTQATVVKIITTNLPRNDRGYHALLARNTAANALTASVDFIGLVVGASN